MTVGDRVSHVDPLNPDGPMLPMLGTVVGVQTRLLVEWDGAEERSALFGGGKRTYLYPPDVLVAA